jgi:hypothetical protein
LGFLLLENISERRSIRHDKIIFSGKIFISKNGNYTKTQMMAKGRQRLSPAIIRGHKEFAAQYPLTDYWEKVDGTRVITLLSAPITISGAGEESLSITFLTTTGPGGNGLCGNKSKELLK